MNFDNAKKKTLSPYLARWLKTQLEAWRRTGILDPLRQEQIYRFYQWPDQPELPLNQSKKNPAFKLIRILQLIGVSLIGIGIISLIAFNWVKVPNLFRIIIIIFSMLGCYWTGYSLIKKNKQLQITSTSVLLLGNLIFGAGIWLIAQMFHLYHHFPLGLWLWALGVLPFVFLLRSKEHYFFALGLSFLWMCGQSFSFQDYSFFLFVVLFSVLFYLAYFLKTKIGLITCIVMAGGWLFINAFLWLERELSIYILFPCSLYSLGLLVAYSLHQKNQKLREYAIIYRYTGTIFFFIVIFALSFWRLIEVDGGVISLSSISPYFWIFSAIVAIGIVVLQRVVQRNYQDAFAQFLQKFFPYLVFICAYPLIIPVIDIAAVSAMVPLIIVAAGYAYIRKQRILLNLLLIYFGLWLPFCILRWQQPIMVFLLYMWYGLFCYILGWTYLARYQDMRWGNFLKAWGLIILFITFYLFSSHTVIQWIMEKYSFPAAIDFWVFVIAAVLGIFFCYGCSGQYRHPEHKLGMLVEEQVLLPLLFLFPIGILAAFAARYLGGWYLFISNFIYLGILITYFATGYRRREKYLKVISLVFLIIFIVTRYFSLQWSLLDKSILFTTIGVIVFVVAIVMEKRKDKVGIIEK